MVFDYNVEAIGIEINDSDEKLREDLLQTVCPGNDIEDDREEYFDDFFDPPQEIMELSDEIMSMTFVIIPEEGLNTLFNICAKLLPNSKVLYATEYEYEFEYTDDDEEEIVDIDDLDEDRPHIERGEKDLWVFDPSKMHIVKYKIFSNENIKCGGGSNGMDVEFSDDREIIELSASDFKQSYLESMLENAKNIGNDRIIKVIEDLLNI